LEVLDKSDISAVKDLDEIFEADLISRKKTIELINKN
jgi:hypothetical protein